MASADAILSSHQVAAGESFKMNKQYAASPARVQVQKQGDDAGSSAANGGGRRRQQAVELEKNTAAAAAAAAVGKQLKPWFAVELDGLNCFETLVPR
ncbi:hypothetical protein GUJ93_ZPchr0004g38755 [Zizania palustris]|uniref:Uncharacterized protein n=1 Tax=Zizania palustris TaxID=103762 RepID=A0A8J5VF17_ZIZPA|nr:hypothetical protein GUJ93_ZPchr0004g38755 [Zizania palustris]